MTSKSKFKLKPEETMNFKDCQIEIKLINKGERTREIEVIIK